MANNSELSWFEIKEYYYHIFIIFLFLLFKIPHRVYVMIRMGLQFSKLCLFNKGYIAIYLLSTLKEYKYQFHHYFNNINIIQ